jgi:hypothetical protein
MAWLAPIETRACPNADLERVVSYARSEPNTFDARRRYRLHSFFVRARNLRAAHPLYGQRRNWETGSRLRKPSGVMPERLFLWKSARVLMEQVESK